MWKNVEKSIFCRKKSQNVEKKVYFVKIYLNVEKCGKKSIFFNQIYI